MGNSTKDVNQILKSSRLPHPEAELLLAFLLKKPREFLLTHPEIKISPTLYRRFRALEKKRLAHWPIAYLTGQKEFYGLNFKVSPATLIPRPETEMIVDEVIKAVKVATQENDDQREINSTPLIIDLGTGSGAIIIAVAAELKHLFPADYKNAKFLAGDISAGALCVAKQNARTHKLTKKIKFYCGDLLTPLKLDLRHINELIITANLPYLTPAQTKESPSIKHEPKLALDGGRDGLKYYRKLFKQLSLLRPLNHRPTVTVLCEIDPNQANEIKALSKKYFPNAKNNIRLDLSKQKRLLITKIRFD